MSKSLRPHGLQHARLPCPLPSPSVCSNSCPLSQWCHPTNHLILCCLLLLLPSIFPSIRVFSKELALYIRWPKYWSFSIGPSNSHFLVIILTWALSTIWYNRSLPTLGVISSLDLQNITSFWFPFKFLFSSFQLFGWRYLLFSLISHTD